MIKKTEKNELAYVVKDVHENQMSAYPNLKRELRYFPAVLEGDGGLDPRERARFNMDGYLTGLKGLERGEVGRVRDQFEALLENEMEAGRGSYSMDGWQHKVGFIYDLVKTPAILDAVEALIGPNILCWGTHFFCKLPGDGKRVPWHQDASFWPLTPSKCVTAWLAIDDAMVENGCMRIVPRSHLHGQIAFRKSEEDGASVLNQTVDAVDMYGDEPVDIELEAGQFSLHSDLILHGSNPNLSGDKRRCGVTLRYIPTEVAAPSGWRQGESILCRGEDLSGTWNSAERPVG